MDRVAIGSALDRLMEAALLREGEGAEAVGRVAPELAESARNLLHYLAFRQQDLRELQPRLSALGLSSLGGVEAHVVPSLRAVRAAVAGAPVDVGAALAEAQRRLEAHTAALLGPASGGRSVRLMVTMPSEAAADPLVIDRLLAAGMDVMRINAAHDDPTAWRAMVGHLGAAKQRQGRECRVHLDLAGPKLRTGAFPDGERVVHWSPPRDIFGGARAPVRIWIGPGPPPSPADVHFNLRGLEGWLTVGTVIRFKDAQLRQRILEVHEVTPDGAWASSRQATWMLAVNGVFASRHDGSRTAAVDGVPLVMDRAWLQVGEPLVLSIDPERAQIETRNDRGRVRNPAVVACELPELYSALKVGDPVLFDDGAIEAVVEQVSPGEARLRITAVHGKGYLGADKGINLPETDLAIPTLSPEDGVALDFAVQHADLIGLSFVRNAEDVQAVQEALRERGVSGKGLVLKIETRSGFQGLPDILLQAMQTPPIGVMVARGDLGVELGFERLAEVQEEILWLAEAAHVPVIWATQVLESMAKRGAPTRAEVTDAAMAARAECVMLNKGPYILEVLAFLTDVLSRMEAHQHKKVARLRRLGVAGARP